MMPLHIIRFCFLWSIARGHGIGGSFSTQSLTTPVSTESTWHVLVLDVDGTLYDNDCFIESQIASQSHIHASAYGHNKQQADDLYHKYGSTIRGLFELGASRKTFVEYSNEVFSNIDLKRLRKYSGSFSDSNSNTGYTTETISALESLYNLNVPIVIASNSPLFHVKRVLSRLGLARLPFTAILTPDRCGGYTKAEPQFWKSLLKLYPLESYTCTLIDDSRLNCQVFQSLGMKSIHVNSQFSLAEAITHFFEIYPTCISDTTNGVNTNDGKVDSSSNNDTEIINKDVFEFTSYKYLLDKNLIDRQSMNNNVRTTLVNELTQDFIAESIKKKIHKLRAQMNNNVKMNNSVDTSPTTFNRLVVDIGAGLLNMLPHVMEMLITALKTSLMTTEVNGNNSVNSCNRQVVKLQYIAFENNNELMLAIKNKLIENGLNQYTFTIDDDNDIAQYSKNDIINRFYGAINVANENLTATMLIDVYVVNLDFMSEEALKLIRHFTTPSINPHHSTDTAAVITQPQSVQTTAQSTKHARVDLVVGCCVADLLPPKRLVSQIIEMCGNDDGGLLYLPITFTGNTSLIRNRSKSNNYSNDDKNDVICSNDNGSHRNIQSNNGMTTTNDKTVVEKEALAMDKRILDLYQAHLVARAHHTDIMKLIHTLQNYGCGIVLPINNTATTSFILSASKSGAINETDNQSDNDNDDDNEWDNYLNNSCSDWVISSRHHGYMWQCMMKFISTGVLFQYLLSIAAATTLSTTTSSSSSNNTTQQCLEWKGFIQWFKTLNNAVTNNPINGNNHTKNTVEGSSNTNSNDELILVAKNIDILVRLPTVTKRILHRRSASDSSFTDVDNMNDFTVYDSYFEDDEIVELEFVESFNNTSKPASTIPPFNTHYSNQFVFKPLDKHTKLGSMKVMNTSCTNSTSTISNSQLHHSESLNQLKLSPLIATTTVTDLSSSSSSIGICFRSLLINHGDAATAIDGIVDDSYNLSLNIKPSSLSSSSSIATTAMPVLPKIRHMVEFYAPRQVRVISEALESPLPFITSTSVNNSTTSHNDVQSSSSSLQLLIHSECSLISTGTELKIFTGDIDSSQPTDLTIQSMEQSLGYPLKYGYSLVGEVMATNLPSDNNSNIPTNTKDINANSWVGQRVFSFSPHGTHHWVNADSVQCVPHDIPSEDAIFLPSVETAVSLVQKGRPMLGERVAVIGAGLIGLLTAMVLSDSMGMPSSSSSSSQLSSSRIDLFGHGSLCIVDIKPERLAMAAALIPGILLYNPSSKQLFQYGKEIVKDSSKDDTTSNKKSNNDDNNDNNNPLLFDKVIELSGSMAGLQTALTLTRDFGTIVLGSLYGEKAAPLVLGMKFHRSHIQLVSSQVSVIPEECSGRWSKARRFALTWHMLRQLKPSRILTLAKESHINYSSSVLQSNNNNTNAVADNILLRDGDKLKTQRKQFNMNNNNNTNIDILSSQVQQAYDRLSMGTDITNMFTY